MGSCPPKEGGQGFKGLPIRTADYRTRPPARRTYASERIMNIEVEELKPEWRRLLGDGLRGKDIC